MSVTPPQANGNPGEGPEPFADADLVGQADDYPEADLDSDPRLAPLDPAPEAITARCVEAMDRWPIEAVGKRPADWLAHDLLLYNLLRDARLCHFHRLLKQPEPWMLDRVAHLGKESRRGLQLAALHYLHLRQLDAARGCAVLEAEWDGGAALRRWERLWNCPPYGADYGRADRLPDAHPCGLPNLCPWCRGRAGVRVWVRLRGELGDRPLMLLRYSTTSQLLERPGDRSDVTFGQLLSAAEFPGRYGLWWLPPAVRARYWCGAGDDPPRGYQYAHDRVVKDGLGLMWDYFTVLTEAQVRAARQEAHLHLDFWGRRLGARHGLKAFAIEPAACEDRYAYYFQHQFAGYFLGLAPEGAGGDADLLQFLQKNTEPKTPFEDEPHLSLGKLRPLLTRAFAWPSVMLFGPEQWWPFAAHTKGWPTYRAVGAWRQHLAEPVRQDLAGPPRWRRVLGDHNGRRSTAARAADERLLEAARPLWAEVLASRPAGRRGRPADKQRLRALLAGQGTQVGRRQLDRIVSRLKGLARP